MAWMAGLSGVGCLVAGGLFLAWYFRSKKPLRLIVAIIFILAGLGQLYIAAAS
jgi:hypothetical protein